MISIFSPHLEQNKESFDIFAPQLGQVVELLNLSAIDIIFPLFKNICKIIISLFNELRKCVYAVA